MNTTNGKIAEQSRQSFRKALLILMKTYKYEEITVTQLSQEADLSRKTFYRLYNTKEDILNEYMNHLILKYIQLIKEKSPYHYIDVAFLYFEFWNSHRDFLYPLVQNNRIHFLYQATEEIAPSIFRIMKSETPLAQNEELLSYALTYSLGGLNNLLIRWCRDGMKKQPEELAEMLSLALQVAIL